MKILLSAFVQLLSAFIILSCNKNPVSIDDNIPPGRRYYVWTVDTIYSPNNRLSCIWGSDTNNIWIGGKGGVTSYERLWHYDGRSWKPYKQYISVFPNCLLGFNQNDVWLGGSDGKILHFDGTSWNLNFRYWSDTLYTTEIFDICGTGSDDLYAIGTLYYNINDYPKSFLLHYDGVSWKTISISVEYVQFLRILEENSSIYIFGYKLPVDSSLESISFYQMTNNHITKILESPLSEVTWGGIYDIGETVYFLIGKDLNRYINDQFKKIISFDINNFGYQVYGRNEKDIFIRMTNGLAHFNGNNIEYLYQFGNYNTSISHNALILDQDIFFIAEDNTTGGHLILNGSL